jgi:hypothetical protein
MNNVMAMFSGTVVGFLRIKMDKIGPNIERIILGIMEISATQEFRFDPVDDKRIVGAATLCYYDDSILAFLKNL